MKLVTKNQTMLKSFIWLSSALREVKWDPTELEVYIYVMQVWGFANMEDSEASTISPNALPCLSWHRSSGGGRDWDDGLLFVASLSFSFACDEVIKGECGDGGGKLMKQQLSQTQQREKQRNSYTDKWQYHISFYAAGSQEDSSYRHRGCRVSCKSSPWSSFHAWVVLSAANAHW